MVAPQTLNPDEHEAQAALSSWFRDRLGTPAECSPLTKEQVARLLYRVRIDPSLSGPPDRVMSFSLYLDLIPKDVATYIRHLLTFTDGLDSSRLEALSIIFHKYQHLLFDKWWYLVDMNILCDYVPQPSADEIHEKVTTWVHEIPKHDLVDANFLQMYKYGCRQSLMPHYRMPTKPAITPDQFLSDPMYWATPGSSDAKRLFSVDGDIAQRSKWATANACSLVELKLLYYDTKYQFNKASPKRERGKARMIISGDMSNYLRMSYVSYWLEDVLRSHPNTTLFYSKDQMSLMWSEMVSNTIPVGTALDPNHYPTTPVNLTLDESKFDHMVTLKMNEIKLDVISDFIAIYADDVSKPHLLAAMSMLKQSLHDGHVAVRFPGGRVKLVKIMNGILSGWRWTALLDTLSNMAKVHAFRYLVLIRTGRLDDIAIDPITDFTSQGDDLRSRSPSFNHAGIFTDIYTEAGFIVHPKKYFVSPYTDEFLRKVALYGRALIGYPARSISTLIFRSPGNSAMLFGEARMREMAASWLLTGRRCGTQQAKLEAHLVRDVARGNNVPKVAVANMLHSPAVFGGVGLAPLNNLQTHLTSATFKPQPAIGMSTIINGYKLPHLSNIIQTSWLAGVHWKKPKVVATPFSVTFSPINITPKRYDKPLSEIPFRNAMIDPPTALPGISPSIIAAHAEYTATLKRSEVMSYSQGWMDAPSLSTLNRYMTVAGMSLVRDWILGKMFQPVAESYKQGSIIMSPLTKQVATSMMATVLSRSKITKNTVMRARYAIELETQFQLGTLEKFFSD